MALTLFQNMRKKPGAFADSQKQRLTPVFVAAWGDYLQAMKFLLEAGTNMEAADANGDVPRLAAGNSILIWIALEIVEW